MRHESQQGSCGGGTGAYAGVTGTCSYETNYLANDQVVTKTDCIWHRE